MQQAPYESPHPDYSHQAPAFQDGAGEDYSWNASSYRAPTEEGVGRWVMLALIVALVVHVIGFFGLSKIHVLLPEAVEEQTVQTQVVRVNRVDIDDSRPEVAPPKTPDMPELEPVPVVPPADELEMLENLPEMEIDIKPDIETVQIPKADPAAKGELEGEINEPVQSPNFEPNLPDMGKTEDLFPRSRESQIAVDPGARLSNEHDPDALANELRKGANGESEDGLLKGFTSLDKMTRMDGNALLTSKALIGSDLLFDFNSDQLRQSARVSLMKVAMLIHKHPKLVCWVDGHTDLIGGEAANLDLSRRRAMAVKHWLISSMDLEPQRIAIRGFGKTAPIVKSGTAEEQAPNRRVEIKMRKSRPDGEVAYDTTFQPGKAARQTHQSPSKPAPKKNKPTPRAVEVEDDENPPSRPPSRAVVEPDEPRRIQGDEPRRAVPVDE